MIEDRRRDDILGERVAVLETQIAQMLKCQDAMMVDIRVIRTTLAEAKGGWRVLLLVGGAAGVVGAALAKLISSVPWIFPK